MSLLKRNRLVLFSMLAFFLFLAGGILIAEIVLRINGKYRISHEINGTPYYSPYTGGRNEHTYRYAGMTEITQPRNEFIHYRKVNSLGFTDPRELTAIDGLMQDSTIRIITGGDSYTEGMGAPADSSWPALLEQQLNSRQTAKKYFVYNAGMSGSDPFFSYQNLKFLYPKIKPQVFILAINFSDYVDTYLRGGWERFQPDGKTVYVRKGPWWEPLYARSHLVRAIAVGMGYNDLLMKNFDFEILLDESFDLIEQAVDSCRIYCAERDMLFVPVFHPTPFDRDAERCDQQNAEFVKEHLVPKNHNLVDLTTIVRKNESAEFFWPVDRHAKAEGNLIFARVIREELGRIAPGMFPVQ